MTKTAGQTLVLGERTFPLRKPKLGQLRQVVDALDAMRGKDGGELIDASVTLILAGLLSANPGISEADIEELEIDLTELNSAVDKVLGIAGLRATATPGEAVPQPVTS